MVTPSPDGVAACARWPAGPWSLGGAERAHVEAAALVGRDQGGRGRGRSAPRPGRRRACGIVTTHRASRRRPVSRSPRPQSRELVDIVSAGRGGASAPRPTTRWRRSTPCSARLPGEGLSTSLPEAMWEAYDGAAGARASSRTSTVSQGLADGRRRADDRLPRRDRRCARPCGRPASRRARRPSGPAAAARGRRRTGRPSRPRARSPPVASARGRGRSTSTTPASAPTWPASVDRPAGLPGSSSWRRPRSTHRPACRSMARTLAAHARRSTPPWRGASTCCPRRLSARSCSSRCSRGRSCWTPRRAVVDLGPTSGDPADDLLELVDAHLLDLDTGGRRRATVRGARAGPRLRHVAGSPDVVRRRPCATGTRRTSSTAARAGARGRTSCVARHRRGSGPRAGPRPVRRRPRRRRRPRARGPGGARGGRVAAGPDHATCWTEAEARPRHGCAPRR